MRRALVALALLALPGCGGGKPHNPPFASRAEELGFLESLAAPTAEQYARREELRRWQAEMRRIDERNYREHDRAVRAEGGPAR